MLAREPGSSPEPELVPVLEPKFGQEQEPVWSLELSLQRALAHLSKLSLKLRAPKRQLPESPRLLPPVQTLLRAMLRRQRLLADPCEAEYRSRPKPRPWPVQALLLTLLPTLQAQKRLRLARLQSALMPALKSIPKLELRLLQQHRLRARALPRVRAAIPGAVLARQIPRVR